MARHDALVAYDKLQPGPDLNQAQAVALGLVRFIGKNPVSAAGFLDKIYRF